MSFYPYPDRDEAMRRAEADWRRWDAAAARRHYGDDLVAVDVTTRTGDAPCEKAESDGRDFLPDPGSQAETGNVAGLVATALWIGLSAAGIVWGMAEFLCGAK